MNIMSFKNYLINDSMFLFNLRSNFLGNFISFFALKFEMKILNYFYILTAFQALGIILTIFNK